MDPESDYRDYLAAQVLSEGNIINYRLLSRALKVHSNVAKQMLYTFYTQQNTRKPSSIHATYLLCGVRKAETQRISTYAPDPKIEEEKKPNGVHDAVEEQESGQDTEGDSFMNDSFFMSSSLPQPSQEDGREKERIKVSSVTLTEEEHLEEVKNLYESVTSLHVYSLEPGPLNNIHLLSDCNRRVYSDYASEDPLETWKTYGTIQNPNAKRRATRRPPPAPPTKSEPKTSGMKPVAPSLGKDEAKKTSEEKSMERPGSSRGVEKKAPSTRKKSDIFNSFAKASSKPMAGSKGQQKKDKDGDEEMQDTQNPAQSSPSSSEAEPDPEPSKQLDEEQEEDDSVFLDAADTSEAAKKKAEEKKKEKKEREEGLRKMMEAESSEDENKDPKRKSGLDNNEPADDADADGNNKDDAMDVDDQPQQKENSPIPKPDLRPSGRRRVRRKIMKKKTTKDAEGYLVTKEEPAWESFSESESEKQVTTTKKEKDGKDGFVGGLKREGSGMSNNNTGAGKKNVGKAKGGQGNIMSFFGKK